MPEARQFLTMLSRATRFIDFYIKKAFEGIEISSIVEFQFLISVMEMKNPPKTDVIYFNLVEVSTGVETLKRLVKKGFLKENADTEDKRVKRVELTPDGYRVLKEALGKFQQLDQLVQGFGAEEGWKSFIPALLRFNELHNEIYYQNRGRNFDQLMDLINKK
jgi:DNA-binding MarR family transcriptional regulator